MEHVETIAYCCTEYVVIFFDKSSEISFMELKLPTGESAAPFSRLTKLLRMFLQLKKMLLSGATNRDDRFCILTEDIDGAIVTENNKGLVDLDSAINQLKRLDIDPDSRYGEVLKLDAIVQKCLEIAAPFSPPKDKGICGMPPYVVRLILFISRSNGETTLELDNILLKELDNPYLFIDSLYIHEPSTSTNRVQATRKNLADLNVNKRGWCLECGPDVTQWHNSMAQLLAHPLVRTPLIQPNESENDSSVCEFSQNDSLNLISTT